MTTNSVVHSNAFNFMSFVQSGVDPRTGQYTAAIELPELAANYLNGPNLPLRIAFNPMNPEDSGFGAGWRLGLSEYDLDNRMLSLHSGERFKVIDNGPGQSAVVPERKIDSFHFEHVLVGGETRYRVAHKSGLIELLKVYTLTDPEPGRPDKRVALPVRILSPFGHGITLEYQEVGVPSPMPGIPAKNVRCLSWVEDDRKRRLLAIDYALSDRVYIDINPNTPAHARYTLHRKGSELASVVLPTKDKARWAFDYRVYGEVRCLVDLRTPVNGHETIIYDETGLKLPGASGRTLPCVKSHVVKPGAKQPDMRTDYRYSSNNFLGNNTLTGWNDNGEDNLYQSTDYTYAYDSTATHFKGGRGVRTVKSTFNRFHLMTEQVTTQNDCIETQTLHYPEVPNRQFPDQPANFQLADITTHSWRKGLSGTPRDELEVTRYDLHGNLIEKIEASGRKIVMTYHPADLDPEGFVRSIETEEVIPAAGEGNAETLLNRYSYRLIASLDSQGRGTLQRSQEQLFRVRDQALLELTTTEYYEELANALTYGRARVQTLVLNSDENDGKTVTEYAYSEESVDGHPVVQTVQTQTGFDHGRPLSAREQAHAKGRKARHSQKANTLQHSLLIGEPLLNYDDNQVQIAYEYDELRRVTRETVDPFGKYKASRSYNYYLSSSDGQQAYQEQVDVKGVSTWSYVDGLNRVVRVERQDPDYGATREAREMPRLSYSARYDELGDLVEEVEFDWLELKDLPLATRYEYDDWRQRSCETGPDGVRNYAVTDPVGLPDRLGPVVREWRESINRLLRTGTTITRMNLFEKPVDVERVDNRGQRVSLHLYFYDGLGRTVREVDGRGYETASVYDEYDRLVDQTLPDRSVVHRDYAPHSKGDLPTLIKVLDITDGKDHVMGTQTFDGLDRMIESVTGGRVRTLLYAIGQRQPEAVITNAGNRIDYEYVPQLGEEPLRRTALNNDASYIYDEQNARLLHCTENDESLDREYFSTGELRVEKRKPAGEDITYEMNYVHSLKARLLRYTDVLGKTQFYEYNPAGQLQQTSLENVSSTFGYDALGRTASIFTETEDEDGTRRSLRTELLYDDFDREILRRFDFGDTVQTLAQTYNAVDGITSKTLKEGDAELRHEDFEYEERARLSKYTCRGESDYVPVDPHGNKIEGQLFRFDGRDNITRVRTTFKGGRVDAVYLFDNLADPAQLTGINMTWADDATEYIPLEYDDDGNMRLDEEKRQLEYDPFGRLAKVYVPKQGITAIYGYDPLDRLVSQDA